MKLRRPSTLVGIGLSLSLISSATGVTAADHPPTPITGPQENLQLPVYAPPKNVLPAPEWVARCAERTRLMQKSWRWYQTISV